MPISIEEFELEQHVTQETAIMLKDVDKARVVYEQSINNVYEECEAMLTMCETYDQKMNVLRSHGVIDDENRLCYNITTL